eukprot:2509799-Pyramimonas_sp.AAC.2
MAETGLRGVIACALDVTGTGGPSRECLCERDRTARPLRLAAAWEYYLSVPASAPPPPSASEDRSSRLPPPGSPDEAANRRGLKIIFPYSSQSKGHVTTSALRSA